MKFVIEFDLDVAHWSRECVRDETGFIMNQARERLATAVEELEEFSRASGTTDILSTTNGKAVGTLRVIR